MAEAAPIGLPLGFEEWMPAVQALTLALLTFVQEDIPTVSAALLSAAGSLSWQVGLLGCFSGIWIGDALLYWLARGVGRPLMNRPWATRCFNQGAVERSEQWFARSGTWVLLASRFVPGTRLPTYLAAGFLRLPFGRFLLVTGVAVGVWTVGIFTLAHWLGPDLIGWIQKWTSSGWILLIVIASLVVGTQFILKLCRRTSRRRILVRLLRWTRWEFWPPWLFYLPVAVNYLGLALRHRSVTLPTAANPGMFSGGFVGESKIATLDELQQVCPEFTAQARLLQGRTPEERMTSLESWCEQKRVPYPFILKPDVGQRGAGVKLIRAPEQAVAYLKQTASPLIVQQYSPGPHEAGLFYYRYRNERVGRIFAITDKRFPVVTGDGVHTIEELIWRDRRARYMSRAYLDRFGPHRERVPTPGEPIRLVEAGNHAQGCIFKDGNYLWSKELEQRIDTISQQLTGFFIGRYDVRFNSADALRQGRGFQIIELNGATSEDTSIYDSSNSLVAAYRTLFRQWGHVFGIAHMNRLHGCQPTPLPQLWRAWRDTQAAMATYPIAD